MPFLARRALLKHAADAQVCPHPPLLPRPVPGSRHGSPKLSQWALASPIHLGFCLTWVSPGPGKRSLRASTPLIVLHGDFHLFLYQDDKVTSPWVSTITCVSSHVPSEPSVTPTHAGVAHKYRFHKWPSFFPCLFLY